MKNIPQPKDPKASAVGESVGSAPDAVAADADGTPILPGTEQPRTLGDMMREAESASQNRAETVHSATEGEAAARSTKRVKKVSKSQARRYARERALQALYQWEVSAGQSSTVREQFMAEQDMSRVDVAYFVRLFNGVSHKPEAVDEAMTPALDRDIDGLDPIERAVLRIATYELTQCLDIPARVVINEGIEITKRFGADKGHRYINGVLDKLAADVRPLEMKRR